MTVHSFQIFTTLLEWAGTIFGLAGTLLLSFQTNLSKYGWLFAFAANVAMLGFAISIHRYGLLAGQIGYFAIAVLGIYRAGFAIPFIPVFKKRTAGNASDADVPAIHN